LDVSDGVSGCLAFVMAGEGAVHGYQQKPSGCCPWNACLGCASDVKDQRIGATQDWCRYWPAGLGCFAHSGCAVASVKRFGGKHLLLIHQKHLTTGVPTDSARHGNEDSGFA
jgi:hypothetical protein